MQSLERFAYVMNNPTRFADPSGHDCQDYDLGGHIQTICASGDTVPTPNGTPAALSNTIRHQPGDNTGDPCGGTQSLVHGICNTSPKTKATKQEYRTTVAGRCFRGSIGSCINLATPTEIGWRDHLEGCGKFLAGGCLTGGVDLVYNIQSDQLVSVVSVGGSIGPGFGAGVSLTTGPLVAWFASDTTNLTQGASLNGVATATYVGAMSTNVSGSLSEDKNYGTYPVTFTPILIGVGGPGYATAGAGVSSPVYHSDLTYLLPWHWGK